MAHAQRSSSVVRRLFSIFTFKNAIGMNHTEPPDFKPVSAASATPLSPLADQKIKWILLTGLVVQILYCLTAVGFLHPDQHFQIIEFSSYQLGQPSGATSVWELKDEIRPTIQVYLFSAFVKGCGVIHLNDAYQQMAVLRLIFGLTAFAVFNGLALYYFKNKRQVLYLVLLLVNFGWTLPYVRTLFSSEVAGGIVFFAALLLYEKKKNKTGIRFPLLTGLLLSFAFYLRFQMAFAIAGFGIWFLFFDKRYKNLLPMAIGFAAGIALNCYLDYRFYHEFVFTPYRYYHINIAEGKAAEFGTSSFVRYILMLALVIGTPPVSIFLFYYSLKSVVKKYANPVVLSTVLFVIGHCLVAHKEERFMFPILNVLPVIAGWSLAGFIDYYQTTKPAIRRVLKGVLYFSAGLNILVLVLLILNPYSQTIEFSRKLKNNFPDKTPNIYCIDRTPFETESKLPLIFYQKSVTNLNLIRISSLDSLRRIHSGFVVTTYNQVKDSLPLLDSLKCKPVFYSSSALWNINRFLQSKKMNTINDIWVVYEKN